MIFRRPHGVPDGGAPITTRQSSAAATREPGRMSAEWLTLATVWQAAESRHRQAVTWAGSVQKCERPDAGTPVGFHRAGASSR